MIKRMTCQDSPAGPTAVALGILDGIHRGHQAVIASAVAQRDLAPAVFTFTIVGRGAPSAKKDFYHLMTDSTKERILEELGVQYLYSPEFEQFKEMEGRQFVRYLHDKVKARAICVGDDFRFGRGAACSVKEMHRFCEELDIRLKVVSPVLQDGERISSTQIRRLVEEGDIARANLLLGHCFSYDFEVVRGRQLGRRLQLPTINQKFPADFIQPKFGVYASYVLVDGRRYPSVTNIGVKPTVGSDCVSSETYIMDLCEDLYGRRVPVHLIEYLRAEERFASLEALREAICRNADQARALAKPYLG